MVSVFGYHWNGGIMRSTDGGQTWHWAREGLYTYMGGTGPIRFSPAYAQDHTIFTLAEGDLYRTVDGGDHWQEVAVEPPDYLESLFISPRYPVDHTLWVYGYGGRLRISRDEGHTWQPVSNYVYPAGTGVYCREGGRCGVELFGYIYKPNATYNIKFFMRSFDGGSTWQCLEDSYEPPL
jgi:photosystem II stability/assembly factor-like uncharacterized protein